MNKNISVIIPTLNRGNYLTTCVKSLLKQSLKPNEIVVVDNSTNQSAKKTVADLAKLSHIPILYFSEPRLGTAFARNRGILSSRYNLLAFIDDDCIATKTWIEEAVGHLNTVKNHIVMGRNLNASPKSLTSTVEYYLAEFFFMRGFYLRDGNYFARFLDTKNFAVKKSLLLKNNILFDEKNRPFSSLEDVLFSMKLLKKKVSIQVNPKMIAYHSGSHDLFGNFNHQFKIGLAYYYLLNKYGPNNKNRQFVKAYVELKAKEINKMDNKLKRMVLQKKSILFKVIFYILARLDIYFVELGYKTQKIKEQFNFSIN